MQAVRLRGCWGMVDARWPPAAGGIMLPCFIGCQGIVGIKTDQTEGSDVGIIVRNAAVSDSPVPGTPGDLTVAEQRCDGLHAVCIGFQLMVSVNTVHSKSLRVLQICPDQFRGAAVIVAEITAMDHK